MLNHLTVQTCTMELLERMIHQLNSLLKVAQQFVHLDNSQLKHNAYECNSCLSYKHALYQNYLLLLSHFKSLICCDMYGKFCNVIKLSLIVSFLNTLDIILYLSDISLILNSHTKSVFATPSC